MAADWFVERDGETPEERRIRYRRESAKRYKSDPEKAEARRAAKRAYHARRQQDESRRLAEREREKRKRAAMPEQRKAEIAEANRIRATAYHEANRERILAKWAESDYWREWRRLNAGKVRSYYARRRDAVMRATPPWADADAIEAIYTECARLAAETGIPHEVDHIIPLQGLKVSGLHVHNNLQVLTLAANRAKSNRFIDGDSTTEGANQRI
jgi:5-methylcytosine-specific restriction endonuclease McrA